MKLYTSRDEREHIEAQFDAYMNEMIRNYAMNVVRRITRDEDKHRSIPLEDVEENRLGVLAAGEEQYPEDGIILEADLKIRVNDEQIQRLLTGLTEREAQVLLLHVVYELDYDEIADQLHITKDRAKSYKYHGMKKAKKRAVEDGGE